MNFPKLGIVLAIVLTVPLLMAPSCGRNPQTPKPAYPLHMLARDIIVAEGAFLNRAILNHGAECRSGCTLATVKDQKLCVKLCNAIKLATEMRALFIGALDLYCDAPGWHEGTAPCIAKPENETQLRTRMADFQAAITDVHKQGGGQ